MSKYLPQPIHLSIHPTCIHSSIHFPIHLSAHPSFFIHPFIHTTARTHPYSFSSQFIQPSIHHFFSHLSIHLSIPIHQFIHLFIYSGSSVLINPSRSIHPSILLINLWCPGSSLCSLEKPTLHMKLRNKVHTPLNMWAPQICWCFLVHTVFAKLPLTACIGNGTLCPCRKDS